MTEQICSQPAEYDGTSKVGLQWLGDSTRGVYPEVTFDSAYFRPDMERLLVNLSDPNAVSQFDQFVFDATKEDDAVAVVEGSAVGVPKREEGAHDEMYALLDDMEDVEVVSPDDE